ncbi:transporter [Escherichia coli]|nr:transporter [Escherichia coli]EFH6707523.1 transporter [Escherichia coli]
MAGNVQEKQLRWYNIALMSFITVWGFGNVVNNYANQGLVVVFSWVFIFALYFTPYFHTLCANCWSVRLDLQRWEGRGQYLD